MSSQAQSIIQRKGDRPALAELSEAGVHVWFAWLEGYVEQKEELAAALTADERARAARFIFGNDRDRYILRRGLLRQILSHYTGIDPADIQFEYEGNGKPVMANASAQRGPHFNVTHSDGLAAYAVARCSPVGIDVERVKPISDWQALVAEHFSERERSAIMSLPEDRRLETFYRGWTRKEAVLKAMAQGIGDGLRRVEVSLAPNENPGIHSIDGNAEMAGQWTLRELGTFEGFMGAVAARSEAIEVVVGEAGKAGMVSQHGDQH